MYCPKCKTQYREGFTVCKDCGFEPLISELEETEKPKPLKVPYKFDETDIIHWEFLTNVAGSFEASSLEALLKSSEIPVMKKFIGADGVAMAFLGYISNEVEIYVPREDIATAKDIAETFFYTGESNDEECAEDEENYDDEYSKEELKSSSRHSIAWRIIAVIASVSVVNAITVAIPYRSLSNFAGGLAVFLILLVCGLVYAHQKRFLHKIVIVIAGIVLAVNLFYAVQPQLVTGKKADLQQVVVSKYNIYGLGSDVRITEKEYMNKVYNILKHSRPVKHTESERFYQLTDPVYVINLAYSDGSDDYVFVFRNGRAVRALDGDNPDGYTVSTSSHVEDDIWLMLYANMK